jgi:hypothetical protein
MKTNNSNNKNIVIKADFFLVEKTNDFFKEVSFTYGRETWHGALPKKLEKQGLDLSDQDFENKINECYDLLNPKNIGRWIAKSNESWDSYTSSTYKVLCALHSGRWECRVCGPVPKINPQPAARLSALKKQGYIIGSQRRTCAKCVKKTMHDILVMLPKVESRFLHGNELRKPMSEILKSRIKKELGHKEVCFDVTRAAKELLIDHKFPSQRWSKPETDNPNDMPVDALRAKFQLLSNQTNMLKSRYCDACVKTGTRGTFIGIKWFYTGDEAWKGATPHDEKGCKGCPWYDLEFWKNSLTKTLAKLN